MARGVFSKIITFGLATTLGNILNAMPVEDSTLAGILPLPKTPSEKIPLRIKKWREQHKDQCVPLVGEVAPKNKTQKSITDVLTRLKKVSIIHRWFVS